MSYFLFLFLHSSHRYSLHQPNSLYFESFLFQVETKVSRIFCGVWGIYTSHSISTLHSTYTTWSVAGNSRRQLMRSILWEVWHFRWRVVVPGVGGGGAGAGDLFVAGSHAALPVRGLAGGGQGEAGDQREDQDQQVEADWPVITCPSPGEDLHFTKGPHGDSALPLTLMEDFTRLAVSRSLVTTRDAWRALGGFV